jgi:hypothetical protein
MGIRSLVLVSFAAALFSVASPAHADVDGGTTTSTGTGSGGSAGSTSGGSTSGGDSACTIAVQSIDGTTCQVCGTGQSTSCSSLGSDYNYACTQPSGAEIYCNGPNRYTPQDQNVTCSVAAPGLAIGGGAAAGFLALAAALSTRRRRA